MCVNNLPRVVTWQWNGRESNLRPRDHQSNTLPLDYQATKPSICPLPNISKKEQICLSFDRAKAKKVAVILR